MSKFGVVCWHTLILAFITCCCHSSGVRTRTELVRQIWLLEGRGIAYALKPKPGEYVDAHVSSLDESLYVVFFNRERTAGVAFDVGAHTAGPVRLVNSCMIRNRAGKEWDLLFPNDDEDMVYELHGGMWSLDQMRRAIAIAANEKAVTTFRFTE